MDYFITIDYLALPNKKVWHFICSKKVLLGQNDFLHREKQTFKGGIQMDKKKIFPLVLGLIAVLFSIDAFAMMGHGGGGTRSEYRNGRSDFNHYRSYQHDHMNGYSSDRVEGYNNHMDDTPYFNGGNYNGHMDEQHMYYEGNNPEEHMEERYYRHGDVRQDESSRYRFKQEYSYEEY